MTAISVSERLLEMAAFYTPLALTVTPWGVCVRIYTSRSANVRAYGACAAAERKKLKRKPR